VWFSDKEFIMDNNLGYTLSLQLTAINIIIVFSENTLRISMIFIIKR